jgi:hypothetical protein
MQGIALQQDAAKEGKGAAPAIVRNLEFLEGELRNLVFKRGKRVGSSEQVR